LKNAEFYFPCKLHNVNHLQSKAKSAPKKWPKKHPVRQAHGKPVWQKNRGSHGFVFDIFSRFSDFARMLPLHVPANQSFA
jgi:hypothetical protein